MTKRIISIYANWRNDVLFLIMAAVVVCLFSEADGIASLLAVKAAGLALGGLGALLFMRWRAAGKIPELEAMAGEE